jgi:transposase
MKTTIINDQIDPLKQQEIIQKQNLEIDFLKEQIQLLTAQLYQKKSEKRSLEDIPGQLNFFEGPAEASVIEKTQEKIIVAEHTRKKSGRKPLPESLPRVEVVHDIPEEQKQCGCGSMLSRIGEEISEQLNYIPAKLEVIRHIRPKYACKSCEGTETEGATVKIMPPPKQIIPKSIATAALLAYIMIAKFVDAMPFYRQEKQFSRLGYEISRSNMINWAIQLGKILKPLIELLKQSVLSGPLIQMDETTIQVLKEKDRAPTTKSYMWVLHGGTPKKPVIYFEYHPTRSAKVAQELLRNYQGVIQTDGYVGYDFIDYAPNKDHVGCWAHARRKFSDVLKAKGKYQKKKAKSGHADQALDFIGQLYQIEKEAREKEFSDQKKFTIRQEKSKPILEAFHVWLKNIENKTPPKGLLGKAILYALNRWEQLILYVDHGFIPIDNNLAENTIRPFVIGRKNWLFCDTVPGAIANARLYSLIETAKANQLNPSEYLKLLFEQLPYAENDDQLTQLLPHNIKDTTLN